MTVCRAVRKYELEDGDLELLKKGLPEHPCQKCCDHECCGCPDEERYEKAIKVYKDRNLYDLALKFKQVYELDQKIAELQKEQQKIAQAIDDKAGIPIVQLISEKEVFDIALKEKPETSGLSKSEVMDLFNMLSESEGYPMEIGNNSGDSTAMGFITPSAAEQLAYLYNQESGFGQFVSSILSDTGKESVDCRYEYQGLKIWLIR